MSLDSRFAPWLFVLTGAVALILGWHGRSSPPELPTFRAPPPMTQPADEPAVEAEEPDVPFPDKPPPPLPDEPPPRMVEAAPPPPPVEKPVEAPQPAGPTIVGSWKVTDMTVNGQAMPGLDQVTMTITFNADGTMTSSRSGGPGSDHEESATYELSNGQLIVRGRGPEQVMSCTFEGNDRMILAKEPMRMVLTRT